MELSPSLNLVCISISKNMSSMISNRGHSARVSFSRKIWQRSSFRNSAIRDYPAKACSCIAHRARTARQPSLSRSMRSSGSDTIRRNCRNDIPHITSMFIRCSSRLGRKMVCEISRSLMSKKTLKLFLKLRDSAFTNIFEGTKKRSQKRILFTNLCECKTFFLHNTPLDLPKSMISCVSCVINFFCVASNVSRFEAMKTPLLENI